MGVYEDEYVMECPYCKEEFTAIRINQMCCSHRCKYTFNNRKRSKVDAEKAIHQRCLDQNYNVLTDIYNSTNNLELIYSKETLIDKGFSFQYLTRVAKTSSGENVISIFNYF